MKGMAPKQTGTMTDANIDEFITRWSASAGAERANFQSFANELCALVGVEKPAPSVASADLNPYAFERRIDFKQADARRRPVASISTSAAHS